MQLPLARVTVQLGAGRGGGACSGIADIAGASSLGESWELLAISSALSLLLVQPFQSGTEPSRDQRFPKYLLNR